MTGAAAVHEAEARLQAILKAVVVGGRTQDPASLPGGGAVVERVHHHRRAGAAV